MNSIQDFNLLWKKFREGSITPEEMATLFELLNQQRSHNEIEKYLREKWEDSGFFGAESYGKDTWKMINEKIHFQTFPLKKNKSRKIKIGEILKYAAIVIATFFLSRFYFEFSQQHDIDNNFTEYNVPFGSKSKLILPDGSTVWLNSGSKISYANDFSRQNRIINLEGEAYFDVTHQQEMPFIVKTSDLNIQVFGTKFNVKSFNDEKIVETTLVKGAITIERINQQGEIIQKIKMKPDEMVNYFKNEKRLVLVRPNDYETPNISSVNRGNSLQNIRPILATNVEIATAWINNRLTFKGDDIESLINKLQRWYGVEITLQNNEIKKARFTGSFDKETIEQALDALKITFPFNYSMVKNRITIY